MADSSELLRRHRHVALEWNDCVLVWGGMDESMTPCDLSDVAILCDGKWQCKKTTGKVPPRSTVIAQIVGDQMYTLKVRSGYVADLVVLDLTSWVWTRLKPEGYTPLPCGARGAIHTKKLT